MALPENPRSIARVHLMSAYDLVILTCRRGYGCHVHARHRFSIRRRARYGRIWSLACRLL